MPVTRISQPGGVDDGLRPEDIGLDRLERVVLACRHLLHCRCVDDDVDVGLEGALEALLIAYVSDEERESRVAELELHVVLLQLVAAQHDDALGRVLRQGVLDELLAERAGTARDEHRLAIDHVRAPFLAR